MAFLTKGHSALIARSPMWGGRPAERGSSADRGAMQATYGATVCCVGLSARGSAGEPLVRPLLIGNTYLCTTKFLTRRTGMQLPLPGLALGNGQYYTHLLELVI